MSSDASNHGVNWPQPSINLSAHGHLLDTVPSAFGQLQESSGIRDDPEQLRNRLGKSGYLFLRGFYDRELVRTARRSVLAQLYQQGFLSADSDPCKARANPTQPTGRALGSPINQNDSSVRDVVFGPETMSFYATLFEDDVTHFDYIWFRTKGPGIGTPVHCDIVYMGRGSVDLVSAWTPLGNIDLTMGGIIILEDSHKKTETLRNYLSRDVDEYCINRPNAQEYATGDKWWNGTLSEHPPKLRNRLGGRWLTAEYEIGDLVVFGMTTVHGSLDNQTDRIRLSVDTRYQRTCDPIDERWVGETPVGHTVAMKRGRVC